jgi:DNA-binding CsgD family transcriptional regulator
MNNSDWSKYLPGGSTDNAAAAPPAYADKHSLIHWLCHSALGASMTSPSVESLTQQMPPRVHETLKCFLAGKSEKETAKALGLSAHTVHHYSKMIYARLSVSSRAELLSRCLAGPAGG